MWVHVAIALLLHSSPISIGRSVSGTGYDGVIISCQPGPNAPCYEPTSAQVHSLEGLLGSLEASASPQGLQGLTHPLRHYKRQYLGYESAEGKVILVTGYHMNAEVVTSGRWRHAIITVNGGGGNYFRGSYHVRTNQFLFLSINAPK